MSGNIDLIKYVTFLYVGAPLHSPRKTRNTKIQNQEVWNLRQDVIIKFM